MNDDVSSSSSAAEAALVPFCTAAKILGVSRIQLRILLAQRNISPVISTTRRTLFTRSQIERVRNYLARA